MLVVFYHYTKLLDAQSIDMSQRASAMLKEDLDSLGPTRVSEVEKSQQKIVAICKRLEEDNKIVIGGSGEQLV